MNGNNIRKVRLSQRKSLMALAQETGSTPSWITYIERYGHIPGPDLRKRIAEVLGVTEEELWPGTTERPAATPCSDA